MGLQLAYAVDETWYKVKSAVEMQETHFFTSINVIIIYFVKGALYVWGFNGIAFR